MSLRFQDLDKPRPADLVNIFYQIFMMITIVFHYNSIAQAPYFLAGHVLVIIFLLIISNQQTHRSIQWIKDFNPIFIILANFTELHYLVHNVNQVDFDPLLIEIDFAVFGVHPTVWLEQWSHPLVVEYLQIVYAIFYFLPIILGAILYKRKQFERFDFYIFVIVYGFYLSYATYFLIPAIGPRFTIDHLQNIPVTGLWFTEGIRETLNQLENIQRDAFPSGHTEITILTMYYAWKFTPRYFRILVVIGISLIISTVYLRYHYVIDVAAGAFLAAIVIWTAGPLYNRLTKK
ncbi:MAG: inositol phosphorylceramide synthase [Calditrichales bacterium]|nr:MAG: inositol phosphorylceramide synthase [Calditrichales bacterium]